MEVSKNREIGGSSRGMYIRSTADIMMLGEMVIEFQLVC